MAEKKEIERGELPAAEFEFVLTKSDQQDLKDPKDICCRGQDYYYYFRIAAFDNFCAHKWFSADGAVFDLAKLLII